MRLLHAVSGLDCGSGTTRIARVKSEEFKLSYLQGKSMWTNNNQTPKGLSV